MNHGNKGRLLRWANMQCKINPIRGTKSLQPPTADQVQDRAHGGRGPDRNSTVMCKCSEEASILTVNPLGKRSETKQDAQYGVDLCKLRAFGVGGAMAAKSRIVKPSLDGVCVHCSRRNGRQQSADSQAVLFI